MWLSNTQHIMEPGYLVNFIPNISKQFSTVSNSKQFSYYQLNDKQTMYYTILNY